MDNVVKERLINEDIVVHTSSSTQVSTFWRCFIILLTIINVTACVTACVCAAYCYKSSLMKDNLAETSTFKPDVGPTASAQAHPNYKEYVEVYQSSDLDYTDSYSEFSDYYDDIYDEDDDSDKYDSDEYDDDEYDGDENDDDKTNDDDDDVEDSDNDDDGEGSGSEEDANDTELDIELKSTNKDTVTAPTIRKRRSATTDCNTYCKDKRNFALKKCLKRCERKKNRPNNKKEPQSIELPAAHFEASFTDNEVQRKVGDEFNSHRPTGLVPLRVFRKSSWFDDTKSPVTFSNSVMTAKSAGIYLVYAQAYIGGKEPSKSIAIVQRRGFNEVNKLRCDNGVNSGTDRMPQLQTCSVTGLMKLETGDTVEIQASKPTDQIMLQSDMTYFGLVKLGGVGVQSKNKSRKKNNA